MTRSAAFKSKLNDGNRKRKPARAEFGFRRVKGDNLWLEVVLLPFQAGSAGLGKESSFSPAIGYLPMLARSVEFDCCGPFDFQPAEFMKGHSFSP